VKVGHLTLRAWRQLDSRVARAISTCRGVLLMCILRGRSLDTVEFIDMLIVIQGS